MDIACGTDEGIARFCITSRQDVARDMAMNKKLLGLFAGLVLVLNAGTATALVIYDWSGTCTDNCTGTATAVLTLQDSYIPGTVLAEADFVSFSYSSSSGSYDIPGDADFLQLIGSTGALPVLSGATLNRIYQS